jgi:uncharacterized membrane protein YdjX (TVP38/TMEM64 family)
VQVNVFASRRYRWLTIAALVAFGALMIGLNLAVRTYLPFVFDPSEARRVIEQFDLVAPAVYVAAHTVQVVLMAIPGYVMAVVGGALFGPVMGTLYTMLGVTAGSAIAFLLARRYGRPVVERVLREDTLERFDSFAQQAGSPELFLFVLIPVLPEDVISFVAGLSDFRLSVFVLVMFLGRLPAAAVAVLAGDGFATGGYLEASLWILSLVAASAYTYYYRTEILDRLGAQ